MRTQKETAEIVEKTITEIRKSENISDKLIAQTCKKYNISESIIRKVSGL